MITASASRVAAVGLATFTSHRPPATDRRSVTAQSVSMAAPAEAASRLQALNRIGNSLYKVSQTGTVSPALSTKLAVLIERIDRLVAELALDVG